jgi:hypothetical protein
VTTTTQTETPIDADVHAAPDTTANDTVIDVSPVQQEKKRGSFGAWFKQTFGEMPSARDEQNIADLAKSKRQRQQREHAPAERLPEVEQLAISADMSVGELVQVLSRATGSDQEVIDGFEDDTEHWSGNIIRNFFIVFFYVVPALAAMVVGIAVGIDFSGGTLDITAMPILVLCVLFEAIPIILMLATSKLISRVMSGIRKSLPGAIGIGLLFILVALGSAAAQWILFQNADLSTPAAMIGAIVRVFALPLAEIAAAIALPILRKKNLDEHINVLKKKNDAKITMNGQRIQNELSTINAAIATKSNLQKEQDYQKKQELANRLIDIISEKVIKDAEKSLQDTPVGNASGYSSRRDGLR